MKKIFNTLIISSFLVIQNGLTIDFDTNNYQKPSPAYGHYAIGDLNGDGLDDLYFSGYDLVDDCNGITPCLVTHHKHSARVLLSNAKGQFIEKVQETPLSIEGAFAWGDILGIYILPSISIADLDNDGDNDIINSKGHVLLNDGNGQFSSPITIDIPLSVESIYPVDLDNDGVIELVYNHGIYKRTSLSPLNYSLQETAWQEGQKVKVADVSNDGFKDLIVFGDENPIFLLINDGQGHFPENLRVTLANSETLMLVVGDVDNDNDADIFLSNGTVLLNNLNLEFVVMDSGLNINGDAEIYLREFVNFNDDEFMDLLIDTGYQDVVLINDGTGHFNLNRTSSFEIGKLNFQGVGDMIVAPIKLNQDDFVDFISLSSVNTYSDYKYQFYIVDSYDILMYENNQHGAVKLSGINQFEYSQPAFFDSDADGIEELLISSSNEYGREADSFFLKDLNKKNFTIKSLPDYPMEGRIVYKKLVISADFNKDEYDDLLITFTYGDTSYPYFYFSKIFFNSESGFTQEDSIDLQVDGEVSSGTFLVAEDFNGDGFMDVITYNGLLMNNGDNTFVKIALPHYEHIYNKPHVADFNLDGVMDFAFADYIYQVKADNTVEATLINSEPDSIKNFIDYNKDGLVDMFVFVEHVNQSPVISQYQNQGDFNFSLKNSYQYNGEGIIHHVDIVDLDGDSIMEVIAERASPYSLNVYQLKDNKIKFVSVVDTDVKNHGTYRLPHDFDSDGKKDIYVGGKIYYYRDFSFLPGLNYDPSHNGHGFSIEPIGSLGEFYTVFYSYDDDGFPEWYSDLGTFEQTEGDYWNVSSNRSDFIRYQYDYITKSASKNLDDAQKGFISHNKCSDDYGSIGINFNKKYNPIFFEYMDKVDWCSQANIAYEQRPNDNISGLWWAGLNDSGWGWSMSLQERADTIALVVVLYYYDGEGNPRWLLGLQEGFEFGQEISVDMKMYNGYARAATPVTLTTTPAGTMQFTINNPAGTNTYTGTMSMDVNYPGAEGGHWQRENIAITRQSNPRR